MNIKINNISAKLKQDIINYYLIPNSVRSCAEYFKISRHLVKQILIEANICMHSKEIASQLQVKKTKTNNLQKYGVAHPIKLQTVKDKRINTCIEHYGTQHVLQNQSVREKIKITCLEKYGVDNPAKAAEIKLKSIATCNKKYGVNYTSQTVNFKNKVKSRYQNKSESEKCITKNKFKSTMQQRYGVDYFPQSDNYAKVAHKHYYYDNIYFDSSWELALWIYAKDHNEQIEHEPTRFSYLVDDTIHYYFPDFKYNNQLIELKGPQFLDENGQLVAIYKNDDQNKLNSKQECMIKNNIKLWSISEMESILTYINSTYGKNYLKLFKKGNKQEKSEEDNEEE